MEDEDGTCLLDVLCDPQALNDFLHGTNELQSEDLLISSGPGEPSLFADTPSPVSLLADDAGSQGTPASGCVDLSFLEEALLASPEAEGDPEEVQASTDIQPEGQHEPEEDEEKEEEEACDILQQSLQEADITEHTLALEAGLEQPGEDSPLYPPGTVLPTPSTSYLSRPLTAPGVPTLPRDTQGAVDPPQPSLLAVGPGCPSLKPTAPQLMGLLPGNVFPTPPPDASFSLSPVQGSSMLIPKALPSLTSRQVLAPAVRATAAPGILLQRAPLPIQPKLPVSIQPRLVQISPKPPGQKGAQGFTFVPGTTSQNILLSPPVGPKHTSPPQPVASLSKPVSLQLVSQGGSIVIQPQGLFRGQSPFLLPGQPSVSLAQTRSVAQPLLNPASSQIPSMPSGGPPASGHLVDGSQILTVPPRQLSFSPVFTTPTGQLALRQGALLSGPVQLQSAPPTVFQMPAQLAGAYAPQAQGQPGPVVHSPALGNHITLINSSGVITPDLASISIVNGPSVVQGVPFASQAQKALVAGMPEGQLSLPPTSVLLLPDRPATEERAAEEQLQNTLQQSRQLSSHTPLQSSAGGLPPQPASAVTLLQALPDANHPPEPVTSLSKHLLPQQEIQQAVKMGHVPPPQQQVFIPGLDIQQPALQPLAPSESLTGTLPVQVHTVANGEDSSPTPLPVIGQGEESGELPTLLHLNRMPTPLHSGMDQKDVMSSPLIGQIYEGGLPTSLLSHEGCGGQALAPLALSEGGQLQSGHGVCGTLSPGAVSVCAPQQQPVFGSEVSGLDGESEPATEPVQQSYPEAPCVVGDDKLGSVAPQDPQAPRSPAQRPLTGPGGKIQPALVTRALVLPSAGNYTEEPLTPAMRRHRFQQQLCLDHGRVLNPNTRSPFSCLEDVVRHLLPYHTCASSFPSPRELSAVDRQFASVSGLLLRGTTDMLNKYRQLLLAEAKQESPSAEMVMLERLFLQSERFTLADERRRARRDPESFLASLRMSDTATGGTGSPSPPPAWTLHSDRPPGLKTYRSSSKGALRLTIKQELGARTIVHNSACDTALSGHKQNYNKQLANGGDVQVREVSDGPRSSPEPRLQQNSSRAQPGECPLLPNRGSWRTGIHSRPLTEALANPECHERGRTLLDLDTPLAKRHKPEAVEAQRPGLPSATLMEDSVLSNHLQSAIDSILELQRLQGPVVPVPVPVPTSRQSHALEKAVSSMLRGQLCPK